MKQSRDFDLLILGGGMAGMTAAIFAARANLKTALIEEHACGGLANWTNTVENFPSHVSINGMELMERVLAQVENLGVEVDQAAEVERLELAGPLKEVETGEYLYTGKAIILATGRQPIRLRLETDSDRIHYCSVCDGSAYKGKKVLVVGGGNSGFDESLYLLSLGVSQILMVEALKECCAAETTQDRLRAHGNVEIRTCTTVTAIEKDGQGCRVTLKDRTNDQSRSVYVDGVFVFIGQKANTLPFRGVVELDRYGYIVAGPNLETNLPGVYAAGDVVQKDYRYLTTAMADGTIAALAAEKYLRDAPAGEV
ncbi:MAG: FAD-dependent oxidoreductase [Chloroflexi bacterium]|nr:FAD-dependent oxidoreductase [Chloroflexota bacterium]MCL5110836.1 FAD-dependent oxidoreductase [Chloroflexota bacterium]